MKLKNIHKYIEIQNKVNYHNHLFEDVFNFNDDILESTDERDKVISLIRGSNLSTTAQDFQKSLSKSKRKEMLTNYSRGELNKMKLFKVPGYNIGYALKKRNGKYNEIVAVHNNEPDIKDIGFDLMKTAIKNGGCFLDHFDVPKLSNLYSKLGFVEYDRDKYDAKYFPDDSFEKKYGKADVVYRVHKSCKNKLK